MAASAAAATPASFPGGEEALAAFIADNIQYPSEALANDIEGVVKVSFTVESDGSLKNLKIVHMVDPDLENEALRIVRKMPLWNPATNDSGAPVQSSASASIPFSID